MKKTVPTAVLWLLCVFAAGVYLLLNLLDSCLFWENLFSQASILNTPLHAVLTLGCGVTDPDLYSPLMHFIRENGLQGSLLHRLPLTLVGMLMLLPAAGALLCRAAGWRIPAGLLAGINLLLHLVGLLIILSSGEVIFILLWCALFAGSVVLLLSCIGVMDGKPVLISFAVLTLVSLIATLALMFFRSNIGGDLKPVARVQPLKALFGSVNDWPWHASQFWPLSRTAWFLFIGAGAALPSRRSAVRSGSPAAANQAPVVRQQAPQPAVRQQVPGAVPAQGTPIPTDALSTLERLAALHQQGAITDEEYLRKKAELLERV